MLEDLRLYLIERLYNIKRREEKWGNQIYPETRDIVSVQQHDEETQQYHKHHHS